MVSPIDAGSTASIGVCAHRNGTAGATSRAYRGAMATHAAVQAVLSTLVRATADERIPVVLRTRRPEQARDLARWLSRAHGSARTVIASHSEAGLIEVRLPSRFDWPDPRS